MSTLATERESVPLDAGMSSAIRSATDCPRPESPVRLTRDDPPMGEHSEQLVGWHVVAA